MLLKNLNAGVMPQNHLVHGPSLSAPAAEGEARPAFGSDAAQAKSARLSLDLDAPDFEAMSGLAANESAMSPLPPRPSEGPNHTKPGHSTSGGKKKDGGLPGKGFKEEKEGTESDKTGMVEKVGPTVSPPVVNPPVLVNPMMTGRGSLTTGLKFKGGGLPGKG